MLDSITAVIRLGNGEMGFRKGKKTRTIQVNRESCEAMKEKLRAQGWYIILSLSAFNTWRAVPPHRMDEMREKQRADKEKCALELAEYARKDAHKKKGTRTDSAQGAQKPRTVRAQEVKIGARNSK